MGVTDRTSNTLSNERTCFAPGSVSIIGYASDLPGAASAAAAWGVFDTGRCVISEIPDDRWASLRFVDPSGRPGTTYTRSAGVLGDPFGFDAGHFGISPREAEQMDPQQRVLLQVVQHAFDHAGIDPFALDVHRTGVFVGASSSDHSTYGLQDPSKVGAQYMLGNTLSILSNRISYQWNLGGPSYTVDTACSSSLFAFDQALKSIAAGEIDTAVVAGVNLLLSPLPFIGFAQASMLSPEGLCRAFGAGGRGYVRSEGAVAFVLRRTDHALRSGDLIRSQVVASGTNNDGRTGGLALPSSEAQVRLIDEVRKTAGYDPDDLAFVEAHGTGTEVGDPLEAQALGRTYGAARKEPLTIGSAKTNFGHLEPASGLVGLLKAQLSLENGAIPASLHAETLNPHIDFERLNLHLARGRSARIASRAHPWLAAVNSFGFGGANAHLVIRQPDALDTRSAPPAHMPPSLVLSASTATSLGKLARAWRSKVADAGADLPDAVLAANTRIGRYRHRLVVPAESQERLLAGLDGWLADTPVGIAEAQAAVQDAPVVFVFSGNGSQWAGMGRHLHATDRAFRAGFEEVAQDLRDLDGVDISALLHDPDLGLELARTSVAQPLLLALQLGLVDALAAQGVTPAAVLGHSVGEVAAAATAGRISRKSAALIVHSRSTIIEELRGTGTMAALETDTETAAQLISEVGDGVEIAALNGPKSLTVAGESDAVANLAKRARKARIVAKKLDIEYPFHSSLLTPVRDRLIASLDGIDCGPGKVAFHSTSRAELGPDAPLDAGYWWDNARAPVRFGTALQGVAAASPSVFLEISPRPVLKGYMRANLEAGASNMPVVATLQERRPEERDAARIARDVLAAGGAMDEARLLGAPAPFRGGPPEYPFDRRRYELTPEAGLNLFSRDGAHPLLGGRIAAQTDVWTNTLSLAAQPWLGDHRLDGQAVLPATAILEMFLAAAGRARAGETFEIRDLELLRPVRLTPGDPVDTRVRLDRESRRIVLETGGRTNWSMAAHASVLSGGGEVPGRAPMQIETAGVPELYAGLAASGLEYGPEFARVEALGLSGSRAVARLRPADEQEFASDDWVADPRLVDAGLHVVSALLSESGGPTALVVPRRIGRVRCLGSKPAVLAHVTLDHASGEGVVISAKFYATGGKLQLAVDGLRLAPFPARGAPETPFWDERMVPAGLPGPDMAAWDVPSADGAPSDLLVIREALAARLAWDTLTKADAAEPRRNSLAQEALRAANLLETLEDGGACPWPDADALLRLLAETEPGEQPMLKTALCGFTGAAALPAQAVDAPLNTAARTLIKSLPASKGRRILCLGHADSGLWPSCGKTADTLSSPMAGVKTARPEFAMRVLKMPCRPAPSTWFWVSVFPASIRITNVRASPKPPGVQDTRPYWNMRPIFSARSRGCARMPAPSSVCLPSSRRRVARLNPAISMKLPVSWPLRAPERGPARPLYTGRCPAAASWAIASVP